MALNIDPYKLIVKLLEELSYYLDFHFDRDEMGDLAEEEESFRLLRLTSFYLNVEGRRFDEITEQVLEKSQEAARRIRGSYPLLVDLDDPLLEELRADPAG